MTPPGKDHVTINQRGLYPEGGRCCLDAAVLLGPPLPRPTLL